MTDDLVKRLRNPTYYTHPTTEDGRLAADRIEQLVATNKQLTAERDRLRGGIEYILDGYGLAGPDYRFPYGEEEADWITDHLIATLKGETP